MADPDRRPDTGPVLNYEVRPTGEVVITRNGDEVLRLIGSPAGRFLRRIAKEDPQKVMARMTRGRSARGRPTGDGRSGRRSS